MTATDLIALPAPAVVEVLDVEAIQKEIEADLIALVPEVAPILQLESAIVKKLIQAFAFREFLNRSRINNSALANLLYFAGGSDLDHLAVFYDVQRLAGENDDRFRQRIILAIQGRSPGGTAPRYRFIAMSSSLRVADAIVYRNGTSPIVHIAVFSTDSGGVADEELLETVRAAVNAPAVKMVSDTIEVRSAAFRTIDVAANIWLLPETPVETINQLSRSLRARWEETKRLGFDMTRSWLIARLMGNGVQRVEIISPNNDAVAAPEEALALGEINLTYMGRGY